MIDEALVSASHAAKEMSSPLYVLTAWNPSSKPLPLTENRAANRRLAEILKHSGCEVHPAICESPDGDWMEEGLATTGLSLKAARSIGRDFDQQAIFELTEHRQVVHGCFTTWRCERALADASRDQDQGANLFETIHAVLGIRVSARFARADIPGWSYEGNPQLPCPYCGGELHVFGNTLQSKSGNPYWAMAIVCENEAVARLPAQYHAQLPALKSWRLFALASRDADELNLTDRSNWVYVIELDDAVGPRQGKGAWVYVGQSSHTPKERFQQHLEGYRSSKWVRDYGLSLRPDLYLQQPSLRTQTEAERYEEFLAERLKLEGCSVKGGH